MAKNKLLSIMKKVDVVNSNEVVAFGHKLNEERVGLIKPEISAKKIIAVPPRNADSWFRASEINELCIVEEVYCAINRKVRIKEQTPAEQIRLVNGTAMHDLILSKIKFLVGKWLCRHCNNEVDEWIEKCPECGGEDIKYICPEYKNEKYKIRGTPDGIGLINGNKEIVEIKTTTTNISKYLEYAWIKNYIVQINIYMWLTNCKTARLFVVNQYNINDSREFILSYNNNVVKNQINKIKLIRKFIKKNEVPWDLRYRNCDKIKTCIIGGECSIGGRF